MSKRLLSILLSQSLIALAAQHVEAQSLPARAPIRVPQTTLVPVTHDSYPLGAADHLNVAEDLSKVGYLEEEYFVGGTANVYDWAPPGAATVGLANAPYTTRMLVRRPIRKERLSGNVIVEILNATNLVDLEIGWALPQAESIRLFLCGDVMTGRGIDQVLRHPNNPTLHEPYVNDARSYVKLAERLNGAIPRPVESDYIWGGALAELDRAGIDLRIVNLETSITSSENYWRHKEIHYRMHPHNIDCIAVARIDCCCLANNHVLDWGYDGLAETLNTLDAAGIAHTGAGHDAREAAAPAVLDVPGKGRVLVFSYGSPTSGVPREWAATAERPGVNFLEDRQNPHQWIRVEYPPI